MKIVWRYITSSRNTYAALYAACEKSGYLLEPVDEPGDADIICYSLNSLDYAVYADEMRNASGIVIDRIRPPVMLMYFAMPIMLLSGKESLRFRVC